MFLDFLPAALFLASSGVTVLSAYKLRDSRSGFFCSLAALAFISVSLFVYRFFQGDIDVWDFYSTYAPLNWILALVNIALLAWSFNQNRRFSAARVLPMPKM